MRIIGNKKGFTLIELIIVVVILGILAAIFIPYFSGRIWTPQTDITSATSTLKKVYGFTDIKIIGANPFLCHESDLYSTEFTARSSSGEFIQGVVCTGYQGENTVRFAP